jgi:hypothetical protein
MTSEEPQMSFSLTKAECAHLLWMNHWADREGTPRLRGSIRDKIMSVYPELSAFDDLDLYGKEVAYIHMECVEAREG